MLQPSYHGRGQRPYVYRGVLDAWHAPGITVRGEETRCAVDAAWLVEKVLGHAQQAPIWPGVRGARDRAIAYGAQLGARVYQQEGAAFLAERDWSILCDGMGLGKSLQALIAAEARLSLGVIDSPTIPVVLILCPALAKRHWQREVRRWTGYDASILDGLRVDDGVPSTRYVIANYDILYGARRKDGAGVVHDVADLPGWGGTLARRFLIVICDECHLLRGRDSRRTKAVRNLAKGVVCVWGLSGTPVPNHIRDLWGQVDVISGGLWGGYWDFAKAHCGAVQGTYGWTDTGSDRLDELRGRMSMFMLGRTKATVGLELPPKTREIYKVDVEMTAAAPLEAQEALMRQSVVAKAFRATAKAKRPIVIQQAVEALEQNQKVVVFCYMREQADQIAKGIKHASDAQICCVHGDLSPEARDAQATVFREAQAPIVFVATIDSVGLAISLVGADLVIFGDLVPEPWKLLQAEFRTYRFNSTNAVLVRYLVATGTVDDTLADIVLEKLGTIEAALGHEADQGELRGALGGKTDEAIVETLFQKLRAANG